MLALGETFGNKNFFEFVVLIEVAELILVYFRLGIFRHCKTAINKRYQLHHTDTLLQNEASDRAQLPNEFALFLYASITGFFGFLRDLGIYQSY